MDIIGLIGPPGWGTSIMEAMDSTIDTVDSIELDLLVLFEKSKFYFLKNVICSRSIPRASTYKTFLNSSVNKSRHKLFKYSKINI